MSGKGYQRREYEESQAVIDARDALNKHLGTVPKYTNSWQEQIREVLKGIEERDKFTFDINGDAFYQQFKDKFTQQGKLASADVMGQAAAMTGGYGNSYAATVGNQAYQAELGKLNDVIPELYQMAYDRHNQDTKDLYNLYSLYADREDAEHNRYKTDLATWQEEKTYLQNALNAESADDYAKWNSTEKEREKTYDNYVKMMTDAGYTQGEDGHWEKAPAKLTSEQTELLDEQAAVYASKGEKMLQSWLEALVDRGLSKETAADIMDEYFPID
jgi:hypothetical protein